MNYGLEGYGLYWYCLELIANSVDEHNLTFELEHDSEVLAHELRIGQDKIEKMMKYMVDVGLFENKQGTITCLKLARRLDKSMTSNDNMRNLIGKIRENHDPVMTKPDKVMQEERRRDKKRERVLPQSLDEVKDYFLANGYTEDAAVQFYGYKENEWHDSKGNPIKNWKLKAQQVWFKPENKSTGKEKKII